MELFRIFGKIVIDSKAAIAELDKTADKAQKSRTKVSDSFAKIGQKSKELSQKFAGVSMAATGLLTSLVATTEMTRDYRTEQAQLKTAFEDSGFSAGAATKTFESLQSVLGETDQSVEAANHLAKLCDNEQELSTWTNICTGVFATFTDSLPIEGLTEAANETAKTSIVTGSLADAINWAETTNKQWSAALSGNTAAQAAFNNAIAEGETREDAFNAALAACGSEQERQQLITSSLNEIYKESAAGYKENAESVMEANAAQENLTNSLAALAEKIEPIITQVKNFAAEVIGKLAGMNQGFFTFIMAATALVAALAPALAIFGAVATGISALVKGFGMLKIALTVAKVAFSTLGKVFLANPIGIVIIAITALVAAFMYLWNNCEAFREFWINLWENIKAFAASAKDKIVEIFNNIKARISNVFNNIKSAATKMKTNVVSIFNSIKNTASSIFNSIKSTASSVWNGIRTAITKPIETARNTIRGILNGIKGMFPLSIGKIFSNLSLPKISVDGGEAPFGIGGKGSLPKFSVTWNAKGAIFDQPTIFATPMGFQGVGEAGKEAVAPIDTLKKYVSEAVAAQMDGGSILLLEQILSTLQAIAEKEGDVYLNGKAVGKVMNKELGVLL